MTSVDPVTRGLSSLDAARDDLLAILNRVPGFSSYSVQFVTSLEKTVEEAASRATSKIVIKGMIFDLVLFGLGYFLGRRSS
jgi:hypothetical protein